MSKKTSKNKNIAPPWEGAAGRTTPRTEGASGPKRHVLFVTWDGASQVYLESLFFPIFAALSQRGFAVDVLQFGWSERRQIEAARRAARDRGIAFRSVRVPPSAPRAAAVGAAIAAGAAQIARLSRGYDVVMPRSNITAAMALAAARGPICYEGDGFVQDERLDFGGWQAGELKYGLFRAIERRAVRRASAVIVRSAYAKRVLVARGGPGLDPEKFFVASNGRDLSSYTPHDAAARREVRAAWGIPLEAPIALYAGSFGPKYPVEALGALFEAIAARRADAHFVVLTPHADAWREEAARRPRLAPRLLVTRLAPAEVPRALAAADLGIALIAQTFSTRAVAPIKLGEYLGCGVPVVSTAQIGDVDAQLGQSEAAYLLPDLEPGSIERAAGWFDEVVLARRDELRDEARRAALAHFGVEQTTDQYAAALSRCVGASAR